MAKTAEALATAGGVGGKVIVYQDKIVISYRGITGGFRGDTSGSDHRGHDVRNN